LVQEYIDLVQKNIKQGFRLAEVGVYIGESSICILPKIAEVSGSFVAIDSWKYDSSNELLTNIEPWKHICDIRTGVSWEVANEFPNESFDMVYIDASHKYSSVIRDIRAWMPKVKVGGILAGHDYNTNWNGNNQHTDDEVSETTHSGVSRAVNEIFAGSGFDKTKTYNAPCETWWVTKNESNKNVGIIHY